MKFTIMFILIKSSVYSGIKGKESEQENMKFSTMFIPSKSSVYSGFREKIWARKYEIYNPVYSPIL